MDTRKGGAMRKASIAVLAISVALIMSGYTKCSPDDAKGKVTDRVNLDNGLPGCEKVGKVCRRVRICVTNGGGCSDYAPSKVKNCTVGAEWPACKSK